MCLSYSCRWQVVKGMSVCVLGPGMILAFGWGAQPQQPFYFRGHAEARHQHVEQRATKRSKSAALERQ